ncbi:MAG: TonB-dependent receptor plug domain-containing protein, partial [Candidatus Korobacteraceae bacterium]
MQTQSPISSRLKQLSLEELGGLQVVTASKAPQEVLRTPAAVYVITQEDIQRSGATNLPDILRLAPGVEVAQIDSSKYSVGIRGFGSRLARAVLVLIDGRSVYTPLFAGVYWEMQDTLINDIDRIEIIRGPGATIWGSNAVNGVINIITKSSRETQGTMIRAGGGNVEQGFASVRHGGLYRDASYRVWARGFTRGSQFHPDARNFDDWRRGQFGFRTDMSLGYSDTLSVMGDYYTSDVGQSLNVSTYSPPAITAIDRNVALSGGNVVAQWKRVLDANSDITVQAYFDRTNRKDINFQEVRNTFDADFVHHINRSWFDFSWGAGIRTSPSEFTRVVPTEIG